MGDAANGPSSGPAIIVHLGPRDGTTTTADLRSLVVASVFAERTIMIVQRVLIIAVFISLVGVPLLVRPDRSSDDAAARRVIVITPHNEQIRHEFGRAFSLWHEREHGERAQVIWSVPGGTSEIRRMLQAQYRADLREGRHAGGTADLLFGGGSYEFNELRREMTETIRSGDAAGTVGTVTVLAPMMFDADFIESVYGDMTHIGDEPLFHADGYWWGAALSGFGIVYNRDIFARKRLEPPTRWADLTHPALDSWVALVNPAQSGSITTAFEAILLRRGWEDGWRILRRVAANARTFSANSARAPIDVSLGDAAAGICIDFFGRFQAQAVREGGGGDRVGYIDPVGETQIDADPIAMLNGAPDPELAERFVRFVLSREGQALWQFPATAAAGDAGTGVVDEGDRLGPERYELRRMPVRRDLFGSDDFDRFIDRVDPVEIASAVPDADRNMRAFIAPLFSAMAVDQHHRLQRAWRAITSHPAYPDHGGLVTADEVDDPGLRAMLEAFDAMPSVRTPEDGMISIDTAAARATIRDGWLRGRWSDAGLWHRESTGGETLRREFTRFFADRYDDVIESGRRAER